MKKNGFTLVEVLAVLIILAILVSLTIPAYMTILKDVRRDNYNSKVTEIETAANKYGERIKDEIKVAGNACYRISVADLIVMGELTSDSDKEDVIYNVTDNKPLLGEIRICYDDVNFDIKSFYTVEFDNTSIYYAKEKVTIGNKIYKCLHNYPGTGSNINATYEEKNKNLPYFEEILH